MSLKVILLFVFVFPCNISAFAQFASNRHAIPYESDCPALTYQADSITIMAHFKGNLTKYFSKLVNWLELAKMRGMVVVNISIDSTGKVCTLGMVNNTVNTNDEIIGLWFPDIINQMPAWRAAMFKGMPVNSSRKIAIYCHVKDHPAFDVSYISQSPRRIFLQPSQDPVDTRIFIDVTDMDKIISEKQ